MTRTCLTCVVLIALLQSQANADLIFTFSPESGGTQTRITLTGSTVALGNSSQISDNTLSFDFVDPTVDSFEFPNPENITIQGSVSGLLTTTRFLIDDDSPGTDDLQLHFNSALSTGETLTGSGTDVANLAFSTLLNGGSASSPVGAQFTIDLRPIPEPSSYNLAGLAGFIALCFFRKRKK